MNPLRAHEIKGTYATLLLPIRSDDTIDLERLAQELDSLVASGVDGIYSNGTAGEFYSLNTDEFLSVNEMLANRCEAAQLPFQIGASFPAPQHSITLTRLAAQLRPGAIQVIVPDWYPPTIEEILAYLHRIALAADPVPLVLYNPPHAKRVLQPKDFARLASEIPTLVGIKIAAGGEEWYRQMALLKTRLSIFVPGHSLAFGYARGAAGSYSNVACLEPAGAKRWNLMMQSDPGAAQQIEAQVQHFMTTHIVPFRDRLGFSNMALDKLLAGIGDWAPVGTRLRWPYRSIDESEAVHLRACARNEMPFLFEDAAAKKP